MANQLSSTILFGSGYSNRINLERVKGNTPFGYYDNDSEFIKDAQKAAAFVAQRLGVGGTGNATTYITELTVYAALEEATTTYGNLVYQYKIRDNYINLEGSNTLPFNQTETADKIVLSEDPNIGSPVYWSDSRIASWNEIGKDVPNSASIAQGEIYISSASINDFLSPDLTKVNNWNFFYYQTPTYQPPGFDYANYDWSQVTYPQFNKVAGPTVSTTHYSASYTTFDTTDLAIFSSIPGSSSFSVTGSNGNEFLFVVTASTVPNDTITTFYIPTGSTANETAQNIATKLNSITANFGLIITSITGSTPVQLELSSSFNSLIDPSSGFEINYLNNSSSPIKVQFTQPNTWLTYEITKGESWIYFFTAIQIQNWFNGTTVNTAYYQDILKGRGLNGKIINNILQTQIRIAESYAQEASVGGYVTEYTGSLILEPRKQVYDLNAWAADSASLEEGDRIEVRQVFYQEPPAIVRYFDPYAGTGTGVQGLLETFGFGSYSPGVNFMLMPVYWDIQKIQAIEFNDQVRKSAFSFDLVNNQLRIFPVPDRHQHLLFKYMKISEKYLPVTDLRPNVVSDVMNVPYRNPIYSNINQVGRSWVFRYALAICKEIEGQIRATFQGSNFGGLIVNGSELLTDSRQEKQDLMTELKEYLDQTTRRAQLERKQQESDFTRQTMNQIPLLIYAL